MITDSVLVAQVDAEVDAMAVVTRTLGGLTPEAAGRVVSWAAARFGSARSATTDPSSEAGAYSDIADVYHSADPKTQRDKVLVVGYWFQVLKGQTDLDAQQMNNELKQLGHGIGNVTMALEDLIEHKPQLAIQTKKAGTTRQARKRYRLTGEGIRTVKSMLLRGRENG
jgi:hypothetical protein